MQWWKKIDNDERLPIYSIEKKYEQHNAHLRNVIRD